MKNFGLHYINKILLFAAILSVNVLLAAPIEIRHAYSPKIHRSQETVVYITNTGTKYHQSSCRYLRQSKIKTTLKRAVAAGNGACKVCRP